MVGAIHMSVPVFLGPFEENFGSRSWMQFPKALYCSLHSWQVAQAQNEAHLLHHGIALCLVEGGSLKWPYGLESFGQWAKRLCQTGEITVTML